ncbi:hypothetical protein V500_06315 [Pseudogymnoascus sp. VKM F-4518 (FW-2643)]|nr:hypothetical protein V500_06315 [Pseudogymnoascus sp. VKM F-4518 (FW-2643)]
MPRRLRRQADTSKPPDRHRPGTRLCPQQRNGNSTKPADLPTCLRDGHDYNNDYQKRLHIPAHHRHLPPPPTPIPAESVDNPELLRMQAQTYPGGEAEDEGGGGQGRTHEAGYGVHVGCYGGGVGSGIGSASVSYCDGRG